MAKVFFTSHLRHVAPGGGVDVSGATVGDALAAVFARHGALRGYVLDDQGRLRLHIAVFVDNAHIRENILEHALNPDSEVYIMQALSGG
jgi:molybdopterin converting factor small subunit